MVQSRQHIIVREEIKFARNDVAKIKESQQYVLSLLHSMFLVGQDRVKCLNSRAEQEKTQSQIRLNHLSDKLESNFASLQFTPASSDSGSPDNLTRTATSDVEDGSKEDDFSGTYRKPSEVTSADKVCKCFYLQNSRPCLAKP